MGRFTVRAKPYLSEILAAAQRDTIIYGVLIAYLVAGTAYVLSKSGVVFGAFEIYAKACLITYVLIMPFVVLVLGITRITHRLDRRRRLAYRLMFQPRRVARFVAGTLLMLLVLLPFESMFASVKNALGTSGFPYDKLAADLDKLIHFGDPQTFLLAVAGFDWLLPVVEINYDVIWFILCFGVLYWVATSPRADGIRLRYFATFFCVWAIVGNLMAGLFPSAGPAFYGYVTGDTQRFASVMDFIGGSTGYFSASATQHYLWSLHQAGEAGFGSGISAFPSMHVALVAMNAMFAAERSFRLGLAAAAYTLFIMLSSVYLGWHYAIDGYGALALSGLIYWSMKRVFSHLRGVSLGLGASGKATRSTPLPNVAE